MSPASATRLALTAALGAACSPSALIIELPRELRARDLILTVERGERLVGAAVVAAADTAPALPDAVSAVADDELIAYTALPLGEPLDVLGLVPGPYAPSRDASHPSLPSLLSEDFMRLTVSGGERSAWLPITELPTLLREARVPTKHACRRFTRTALPPLPDSASFVLPWNDGHLVGSTMGVVRFIPAEGEPIDVTPAPIDEVPVPFANVFPISDAPDQLWTSGPAGAMWRVRLDSVGRVVEVLDRRELSTPRAIQFFAGEASLSRVALYFLSFDGKLGFFDGASAQRLHDFSEPPDVFISGGLVELPGGALMAVRSSDPEAILIEGLTIRRERVAPAGIGLYSIGVIGDRVLIGDARGDIYEKVGPSYERLDASGIPAGVQAFIPMDGGFLVVGGEGRLREWRDEGGFCPIYSPLVTQSIRLWSRRSDGAHIVTGPHPHIPGRPDDVPLSIFREIR